jgi:hypothetical protein
MNDAQLRKEIDRANKLREDRILEFAQAIEKTDAERARLQEGLTWWKSATPFVILEEDAESARQDEARREAEAEHAVLLRERQEDKPKRYKTKSAERTFAFVFAGSFPLAAIGGYFGADMSPHSMLADRPH